MRAEQPRRRERLTRQDDAAPLFRDGGSFLCAENFCVNYRVAGRGHAPFAAQPLAFRPSLPARSPATVELPPPGSASESSGRFCFQCGAYLPVSARFCDRCGSMPTGADARDGDVGGAR